MEATSTKPVGFIYRERELFTTDLVTELKPFIKRLVDQKQQEDSSIIYSKIVPRAWTRSANALTAGGEHGIKDMNLAKNVFVFSTK